MTPSIVEALAMLEPSQEPQPGETHNDENKETETSSQNPPEPSLDDPQLGNPISHGQIVNLWKKLRVQGNSTYTLEQLLRGAFIYIPPPPPKPEPSPQYKALMARLRREEEARSYERMINPVHHAETFQSRFPYSASSFAEANKPTSAADIGDEDVSFTEVHRQVTLIINFLVSIAGVAATLWIAARWWSVTPRLFLTLGGSILVAIAEVVVYSGYMWRMDEARKKEGKVTEVKEVMESWVVGQDDDKQEEEAVLIKDKQEDGNDGKRILVVAYRSKPPKLTTRNPETLDILSFNRHVELRKQSSDVEMTPSPATSRSATRSKPLRTYGKRNISREDSPREPSPKKRRISTEQAPLDKPSLKCNNTESSALPTITPKESKESAEPTTSTSKSSASSPKKGSILSFFKPVPSSSSTIASSPKSDEPQPDSTPPSSPPHPPRIAPRRKPRLLRFRSASLPVLDSEDAEGGDEDGSDPDEESHGKEAKRRPLQERRESLSNQDIPTTNINDTKQPRKSKPKASSAVQTTLNLSSQAAFSECKVCNTVWNPLYPDDVKFHTKQHAAVLRARRKLKESEL
ncbi:hypothetical protein FZEAL_8626 [Fusarium zealandicum]|uniref:N-acetyltransferase ESCO zinc-finger domain-containing protein n=1 Tax=Fusarium zealandicum TaxID=1053134 RepID=A0A8H4XGN6_9HYPO|nr:hypothetical protein FZEAL_8626 [Fusarium zealandicum]